MRKSEYLLLISTSRHAFVDREILATSLLVHKMTVKKKTLFVDFGDGF